MATVKSISKKVESKQKKDEKQNQKFIKSLDKFMGNALEEIVGELNNGNKDPALYLGGLIEEIKKRGLEKEIGKLQASYGKELKSVMGAKGEALGNVDKETLNQLIKINLDFIQNKVVDTIGELRPVMLEQVIMGQKIDLKAIKQKVSSKIYGNIKTELNTATITFSRTLNAVKDISLGFKKYLYTGPLDDVTRAFCEEVLTERNPPIYTIEEIGDMDNGQIGDVWTTCGGYNCRHIWVPVDDLTEKELKGEEVDLDAELKALEDELGVEL